jgi:hypothetical protein
MGDPSNRWLVNALRDFKIAVEAAGCTVVNADITIGNLVYSDQIVMGDSQFEIHASGMSAPEKYERRAEAFRKATGMLAPGKDEAAAAGSPYTREDREAAWVQWCKENPNV